MSDEETRPEESDEIGPIVPMDSDAGPVEVSEPSSETTARHSAVDFGETKVEDLGGPDDNSDEKPVIVHDDASDVHRRLEQTPASELQEAYECLEIRTPLEELRTYASARLEALVRMGEADRAETTSAALELGLNALREVMGAVTRQRETP